MKLVYSDNEILIPDELDL